MYEGTLSKSASFGYLSNLDKAESTDTDDDTLEESGKIRTKQNGKQQSDVIKQKPKFELILLISA